MSSNPAAATGARGFSGASSANAPGLAEPEFAPWPRFSAEEIAKVGEVMASGKVNYWTGTEVREFEVEFARYAGAHHAIGLANGTLALDLALAVADLEPGDEVIVTPRSFVASASCVVNAGLTPVFADVDPDTQNLSAETVAAAIGPRTRAVIVVHLAGMPADMDPIVALAERRGLFVIEDCAQAHGARYRGRSVGTIGRVGTWSFCQDKIMTTGGEGGMVTTDDPALWERMWSLKDHGKNRERMLEPNPEPGKFKWVHDSFGTNFRMLEMQAAIGRVQLRALDDWKASRNANAAALRDELSRHAGLRVPVVPEGAEPCYYKCYAFLADGTEDVERTRDRFVRAVIARGVPCFVGSCPEIYRERAFASRGLGPARRLPVAKALGESSVMFLVHPGLEGDAIERTRDAIGAVARECLG